MLRRIAIAVGDTAGHVLPALAVAEAYRAAAGSAEIRFFTAGTGAGHWLLERAGYPTDRVPGSQIVSVAPLKQLAALGRAGLAVVRSRRLLTEHEVRLVIGTGGYGSAGPLIAARTLGLTTALLELNVTPGLANRLLGHVVHCAMVGGGQTVGAFPAHRAVVTGVPVRQAVSLATERHPARLPHLKVLITSGSRGEHFFGAEIPRLLERLQRNGLSFSVHHQGGTDAAVVQRRYDALHITATVEPFIDDMPAALAWADFVIARAGAGTIAELAIAGVPSLLVPLADAAHDHQTANARAYVQHGAALMWSEHEWQTEHVAEYVGALLGSARALESMSHAALGQAVPDAPVRVVRECEQLMAGRW
jgi:UDP-N-acetylglucosamine--N-acetylmuramyl-(pentapeptide) pyrophosphoryl-undecaprenol N-acetylglucosamine transferase